MTVAELEGRRKRDGWYRTPSGLGKIRADLQQSKPHSGTKGWPITGWSCFVHPSQVPEAQALAAKHGCPTEFTKRGEPIWRDQRHQDKYLKAIGRRNWDR